MDRPHCLDDLSERPTALATVKPDPGTGDEGQLNDSPAPNGSCQAQYAFELDIGLRPWKVVLGCFCLSVAIYGLLSSIGLFQTYWHDHQLSEYTESEISWIISIFGFLDCFFAGPSGFLFDQYGPRWLLPVASIVYVSSFVGLAFSTTFAHFMGCFTVAGVFAGTSCSHDCCTLCRLIHAVFVHA